MNQQLEEALRNCLKVEDLDDPVAAARMTQDAVMLGDVEGLAGHAATARLRLPSETNGKRKR